MSANSLGAAAGTGFDTESLLQIGTKGSSVGSSGCGLGNMTACAIGIFSLDLILRDGPGGPVSCGFRYNVIPELFWPNDRLYSR